MDLLYLSCRLLLAATCKGCTLFEMDIGAMQAFKKYSLTFALLILSLALIMQAARQPSLEFDSIRLTTTHSSQVDALPLQLNHNGSYRVQLGFNPGERENIKLRIIPDDRLVSARLNGQPVSLDAFSHSQLTDYGRGFVLPLEGLKPNQKNSLYLILHNTSNPAGLDVRAEKNLTAGHYLIIALALLLLVVALARHLPLSRWQLPGLALGLAASVFYLSLTEPGKRTFDVYEGGGHRDYIHYLIEHQTLPPPGDGWEYHQPPLYYGIAAITKFFLAADVEHNDVWGQLLALMFWAVFLVAALATFRRVFIRHPLLLLVSSLALCLWPAGIIHSIRIGNDLALYAFYALGFYYTLGWWRSNNPREGCLAALWAFAALLTKSNALALWGVLGILGVIRLGHHLLKHRSNRKKLQPLLQPAIAFTMLLTLSMAINLGDNIWHYLNGESDDWLLSNVSHSIHPGLSVENTPSRYLIFDVATFLNHPFISSWDDAYGRQYFWNYVLRSALTSEFFFDGKQMKWWGITNGVLWLLVLAGMGIYALMQHAALSRRQQWTFIYRNLPWLLGLGIPFILLLCYRIKVPISCNTDFRYIYPALVCLLFFSFRVFTQRGLWLPKLLAAGAPLIGLSTLAWLYILQTQ